MRLFEKKTVLITGASSGIGEALAREFFGRGAGLILLARRLDRLESLAKELTRNNQKALAFRCDVSVDGDLERAVQEARKDFSQIDVVVANAGFGVVGNVAELNLLDFHRQFETNIFGVLRTFYATLEELKRSRGSFAVMGSVAGYVALPGASPYAMSKFAIRALASSLAGELSPHRVSVTHIAPGFVESNIRLVDNQGIRHETAKEPMPKWLLVPTEKAALEMVNAIAKRKREIIITSHGRALVFLQRHAPWLVDLIMNQLNLRGRREPRT